MRNTVAIVFIFVMLGGYPFEAVSSPTVAKDELDKIKFTKAYSNMFIGELGATVFGLKDAGKGINHFIDFGDLSTTDGYLRQSTQQTTGSGDFGTGAASALAGYLFSKMLISSEVSLINNHLDEMRAVIKDLNLREMLEHEIRSVFNENMLNQKPLNISKFTFIKERGGNLIQELAKPGEGSVLLLDSAVFFSKGFRALSVATIITLALEPVMPEEDPFGDEEDDYDIINPIYQSKLIFRSKAVPEKSNPVEYWKKENLLKDSVENGIKELGKLINIALLDLGKEILLENELKWDIGDTFSTSGYLIRSENGRDLVYSSGGMFDVITYYSFSKDDRYNPSKYEYLYEDEE